jgi:hypothetical protein
MFLSRPLIVYLVMIAVLVIGLWTVLALGRNLSAPEDLAGKWQLHSAVHGIPDDTLAIEQSGRFFQIAFNSGPHAGLKLTEKTAAVLRLSGGDWQMTVTGPDGGDDKTIQLNGPVTGRWTAHRIVRTFPADVSQKEKP